MNPVRWAVLLAAYAGSLNAEVHQTAAELDWQPRELLSPEALAKMPGYCKGSYIQPPYGIDGSLPREYTGSVEKQPMRATSEEGQYNPGVSATLMGNAEIEQGNYWIRGKNAFYDEAKQVATVDSGVVFRAPSLLVKGDKARYDLAAGSFELESASYLVHDLDLRGEARKISRPGGTNIIVIENGVYTTCAPSDEDWSLEAKRVELDRDEGFGTAYNAFFRIEDVPVLYVPYVTFPIDDRRKSGFLYPSMGSSNTGRGIYFTAPYYFNLAPDADMTYTPSIVNGRGYQHELEGRYLNEISYTEASFGYISHDSEYAKEYPDRNAARWGLDFENRTLFDQRLYSEINYSAVGDDNYLSDLNRNLTIDSDTHLERYWALSYGTENWDLRSKVEGYQTIDPVILPKDRPYMRLPQLSFSGLWSGPVDFELYSEYNYFWRNDENLAIADRVKGSRWQSNPRISLPWQRTWGYIVPAARLDHTDYILQDRLADDPTDISRNVPFYSLDSGLYFDRQFEFLDMGMNQSLEPRLFYVYSPYRNQDEIPNFDTTVSSFSYSQLFRDDRFVGGDRVGDNNRMTVGLTSRFNEASTGIERARLSIGQVYYYEDRRVDLDGQGASTRSDSVLAGEAYLRPNSYFYMKVDGLWDPRGNKTEQGSTTFNFHTADYAYILNFSHRYIAHTQEQTDVSTIFPLNDRWSGIGRWLFNLPNHRTIGTLAGVEYSNCCWRLQFVAESYLQDTDVDAPSPLDHGFFVRFYLKGLTGVGNGLESAIGEAIEGYDQREEILTGRQQRRSQSFK